MANPPPLIAITGYGQERDREASFQAGFYEHMTKPVDIDKLVALLDRLLGGRHRPSPGTDPDALLARDGPKLQIRY